MASTEEIMTLLEETVSKNISLWEKFHDILLSDTLDEKYKSIENIDSDVMNFINNTIKTKIAKIYILFDNNVIFLSNQDEYVYVETETYCVSDDIIYFCNKNMMELLQKNIKEYIIFNVLNSIKYNDEKLSSLIATNFYLEFAFLRNAMKNKYDDDFKLHMATTCYSNKKENFSVHKHIKYNQKFSYNELTSEEYDETFYFDEFYTDGLVNVYVDKFHKKKDHDDYNCTVIFSKTINNNKIYICIIHYDKCFSCSTCSGIYKRMGKIYYSSNLPNLLSFALTEEQMEDIAKDDKFGKLQV